MSSIYRDRTYLSRAALPNLAVLRSRRRRSAAPQPGVSAAAQPWEARAAHAGPRHRTRQINTAHSVHRSYGAAVCSFSTRSRSCSGQALRLQTDAVERRPGRCRPDLRVLLAGLDRSRCSGQDRSIENHLRRSSLGAGRQSAAPDHARRPRPGAYATLHLQRRSSR